MIKTLPLAMVLMALGTGIVPSAKGQTMNDSKTVPHKKLIQIGWDEPDTAYLRAHWQRMEAAAPFDGVVYNLKFTAEGKTYDNSSVLGRTLWKREWLAAPLADMKACRFMKFADNFIRVNTAPGDLKWEDDAAWNAAATNMGTVAWFAKQTGTRGIMFDTECYAAEQWRWNPASPLTFAQTCALARKRGAQTMQAIAKQYPEMTFLSMWLFSLNHKEAKSPDPLVALQGAQYGLWPDFLNGLLDAAPPALKLVDACEFGYYPDDRNGYLALYNQIRNVNGPLMRLCAPELRAKYARQVTAGFGFYLDRYLNRPTDTYSIAPLPGGTQLERLGINLNAAMDVADEYVWAYGEQSRWWKRTDVPPGGFDPRLKDTVGRDRLWEEAMPGITTTINTVRDPALTLQQVVALRTPAKNLAINPGFDQEKPTGENATTAVAPDWQSGAVPGFEQYQDEKSKGAFTWDKSAGAAQMQGVTDGCFIQKYRARPGERFLIEVEGKGAGHRLLMARWQTADGKWTQENEDFVFGFAPPPGKPLEIARGIVTVPDGAGQLVLLLCAAQQKPQEACWFDNLGVYRLQDLFK